MKKNKNDAVKQSKAIANQINYSKLNQSINFKDNRDYPIQTMMSSLRPRKMPPSNITIPSGYTPHFIYKNVLTKPVGSSQVLMWSDAKKNETIATNGDRKDDLKDVSSGCEGYDWHHCELQDASGTCLMQLVPQYQHNAISHIGAIDQYGKDPRF